MKTIIFDFDGTIADTFKLSVDIAHEITGHEVLLDQKKVAELKKDSLVKVAEQLDIPKYRWPFLVIKGRRLMSQRLKEIKPFDGMEKVLRSLNKMGYRVYIMSTNSTSNISTFLSLHGLSNDVEKIYGGVGLLSKASALKKIIKANKLTPDNMIYIGDEVRDIEAAKRVNVPIIAVSWGFNAPERLEKEQPTLLIHSRPELLRVLES